MAAIDKYQKKQLRELRSNKPDAYAEASIYTILLDLCEGNKVEDIFMMLHNVATDIGERKTLERLFREAKKWNWEEEKEVSNA